MKDEIGVPNGLQKVGLTVKTEVCEERPQPLLVEPIRLIPKLTPSSINPPPQSPTINLNSTTVASPTSLKAPRDTGRAAWLALFGVIIVQGFLFAFPLTFGVFQNFFGKNSKLFNPSQSIWIGVLSTGVPFLGAPFMTALCESLPQKKWRYYVVLGWAICATSLIGASFSKCLLPLALTQGVLYGIGLLVMDVPALLILNTWFVKRRGTAYGLLFGTTDLLGFGGSFLAGELLQNHGLRCALLTFGCMLLGICGPAMWLLRPRPVQVLTPVITERQSDDINLTPLTYHAPSDLCNTVTLRYYRRPIFYVFTMANLFHSFAFYLPFIYLPSYTTNLGHSATVGTYLLAAANFAQIFGEIGFGQLSDRVNVHCLVLICSSVSSIAALLLWGRAHSLVELTCFALIFGSFGSGFISLWARMGIFFGQDDAQMIYSIMSFGRGLGSIASGPISSALLTAASSRDLKNNNSSQYGNGKYLCVVLFVGLSMTMSGLMGMVGLLAGWHRNELGSVNPKRVKTFQNSSV